MPSGPGASTLPHRMPPSRDELMALADDALAVLEGEAQATAWWERRLAVGEHGVSDLVQQTAELVVLRQGRVGASSTTDLSEEGLRRAAAAAEAHAELDPEPVDSRRLPDPATGRPQNGWDPAVLTLDAAAVAGGLAAEIGQELLGGDRAGGGRGGS